jgi:hypothetical protein
MRDFDTLCYAGFVWLLRWRRRVPVKTRRPEGGNGIRCYWGFAAGPFA